MDDIKSAADCEWEISSGTEKLTDIILGSISVIILSCSSSVVSLEFLVVTVLASSLSKTSVEMSPMIPVRSHGQNSPRFQSRQAEHRAQG
jgi:hypothetical protein